MIRWLGADDLAAWRDIRSEALRLSPTAFLTTLDEFEAEPDAEVAAKLAQGNMLAQLDGAQIVATAGLVRMTRMQTRHRADIVAVYVRPAARGTGVADALLEHLIHHARSQGLSQLELYVEATNDRAIAFYERHGFVRYGTVPSAVRIADTTQDDYFYVRHLSGA